MALARANVLVRASLRSLLGMATMLLPLQPHLASSAYGGYEQLLAAPDIDAVYRHH